jgi:HSP20 family protein
VLKQHRDIKQSEDQKQSPKEDRMGIARWNPVREMVAMQNVLDRMFDDTRRPFNEGSAMPLDIHEDDTGYRILSAIPGADPDSVQVRLHDGVLTISAEVRPKTPIRNATESNGNGKGNQSETPKSRVLMQENFYGKYTRSVRLPEAVDDEGVTAEYDNGILTLTLPKVAKAQPKQIAVQFKK